MNTKSPISSTIECVPIGVLALETVIWQRDNVAPNIRNMTLSKRIALLEWAQKWTMILRITPLNSLLVISLVKERKMMFVDSMEMDLV